MTEFFYLLSRLFRTDWKDLNAKLELVNDRTGKSKGAILWDMVRCLFRFGADYRDYAIFGMHDMDDAQRATVLTGARNSLYLKALNRKEDEHYFTNKLEFLRLFKNEYGREYLDLSIADADTFTDFVIQHPTFIAKSEEGLGLGAEKCTLDQEEGLMGLYNRLKTSQKTLLEEALEQHPALEKLYPKAINTIRMVTMVDDEGNPHLLYSALRIGQGGAEVDNFDTGGLVVPIHPKTGKLEKVAVNKEGLIYERHPDTDIAFEGLALPLWKETMLLTYKACKKVEGVRLVGWNLALTPKGPVLVEGNLHPTHEIYRPFGQNPDQQGLLPAFEAVMGKEALKKKLKG